MDLTLDDAWPSTFLKYPFVPSSDCRDESTVDASALTDCIAAVSEDVSI